MNRARALAQLVRIPNLFTAAADVLAGFLFVGAGWDRVDDLLVLVAASIGFYAGGVTLNDVFDAVRDAADRPERPIPSGMISRRAAGAIGILLLASGVALCSAVSDTARWIGLCLVGCIVGYNGLLKNTLLAPAVMGMCRSLNLLLGLSVLGTLSTGANVLVALLMWLYVASITFFARDEARVSSRQRLRIGTAGLILAVVGLIGLQFSLDPVDPLYLLLVGLVLGTITLAARKAIDSGTPGGVQQAVQVFVLCLIPFDACLVFAARGPLLAGSVVLLLVPAILSGRWIKVT